MSPTINIDETEFLVIFPAAWSWYLIALWLHRHGLWGWYHHQNGCVVWHVTE